MSPQTANPHAWQREGSEAVNQLVPQVYHARFVDKSGSVGSFRAAAPDLGAFLAALRGQGHARIVAVRAGGEVAG